jgi:hypothetical protein
MDFRDAADSILKAATSVFGRTVTYTSGATSTDIQGVFDRRAVQVDRGDGVAVSSFQVTLGIRLADLAAKPKRGDTVTVDATDYRVEESQEDGQGGATLVLKLDA